MTPFDKTPRSPEDLARILAARSESLRDDFSARAALYRAGIHPLVVPRDLAAVARRALEMRAGR